MGLTETQSRPPTLAFTSRCDARHLATLALMWQGEGEMPRSVSELVRLSLETFVEVLVDSKKCSFIPTQGEAQEVLGGMGLLGKGLLRRNLVEAITREGNLTSIHSTPYTPSHKVAHDSPDLLYAARQLEEALSNPEEFSKRQEDNATQLRDLLRGGPEGGRGIV